MQQQKQILPQATDHSTQARYNARHTAISRAEVRSQFFLKSDLFLCFVHPQSTHVDTLGEMTSSMWAAYIKYNSDLTR